MSTASKIHKEMLDAWNRRDFQAIRNLYHPEYTYRGGDGREIAGGPDTGVKLAQMWADAFPDAKTEIKKVIVQGDTAVCEFVGYGTHRGEFMGASPTGKHVEINICNIMEIRDGKIYREREYIDFAALFSQLGLTEFPAAVARAH